MHLAQIEGEGVLRIFPQHLHVQLCRSQWSSFANDPVLIVSTKPTTREEFIATEVVNYSVCFCLPSIPCPLILF